MSWRAKPADFVELAVRADTQCREQQSRYKGTDKVSAPESVIVQLPPDVLADLDRWIAEIAHRMGAEPDRRSDAIRDILQNHFESVRHRWQRGDARQARAAKTAAKDR
jgi:hypothetical protein